MSSTLKASRPTLRGSPLKASRACPAGVRQAYIVLGRGCHAVQAARARVLVRSRTMLKIVHSAPLPEELQLVAAALEEPA